MTVVYIDSVFVLNTLMDYLLCLVTARLAGIPLAGAVDICWLRWQVEAMRWQCFCRDAVF